MSLLILLILCLTTSQNSVYFSSKSLFIAREWSKIKYLFSTVFSIYPLAKLAIQYKGVITLQIHSWSSVLLIRACFCQFLIQNFRDWLWPGDENELDLWSLFARLLLPLIRHPYFPTQNCLIFLNFHFYQYPTKYTKSSSFCT